ncbi:MAG: spermidine synthase [Acidobacteriota bacterium]
MKLLYGCAVLLGSLLLFLIQPVVAKLILPWFGGSAAVWATCLAFFQTALLLGYVYAHLLVRWLTPRRQAVVHTALLAVALALMPAIPGPSWKPRGGEDPAWRILMLLTAVIGLPYLLLSATSPLVQSWFARRFPGSRPYRLFAVSNLGALAALAAYPVWIEPRLAARAQDVAWSAGFAVFAVLCGTVAWLSRGGWEGWKPAAGRGPTRQYGAWIALSAAGSMLLVATTNQLSQNVAAVPFLWILPLAIYLLTFILCFESPRWYKRGLYLKLLAVALGSVGYAIYDISVGEAFLVAVPVFSIGLFLGCMYCHGELARCKPEQERLTSFYLMVSLGGALGGVFVGLVAPRLMPGVYELALSLVSIAALALWLNWREGLPQRLLWGGAVAATAAVFIAQVHGYQKDSLVAMRSFYGAVRVVQTSDAGTQVRTLFHGSVKHGSQSFLPPARRMEPTTYYGPESGAGLALRFCCEGPKRVGVVGLGTGTLAAYGRSGDVFRFYEINPQVTQIARTLFTFLSESPARTEVTPGDARLSLEREAPQGFDVLAVDAFSGDAIPVHLLTKEAFALYLRHLRPGGIVALHVSNQYLELAPVAGEVAAAHGVAAVSIRSRGDREGMLSAATWVLATRNEAFLAQPEIRQAARPIRRQAGRRVWTDDYNNLFQAIKTFEADD